MLDPRLQTFLVLCDTMSYTRAAKQLCLTQLAVTQHIHYLEKHYGCKLVSYQGKVLRLTPAGERLREMVRSLSYNSHKMEEALASPRPAVPAYRCNQNHRRICVGAGSGTPAAGVPGMYRVPDCGQYESAVGGAGSGHAGFCADRGLFDKARYGHRLYRREEFSACALRAIRPLAGSCPWTACWRKT